MYIIWLIFFSPVDEGKFLIIYHTTTEILQITLIIHTTVLICTCCDHIRLYEKSSDCMESSEQTQISRMSQAIWKPKRTRAVTRAQGIVYYYSSRYIQMKLAFGTPRHLHRAVWTKANDVSRVWKNWELPWKEVLKTIPHVSYLLLQTIGKGFWQNQKDMAFRDLLT